MATLIVRPYQGETDLQPIAQLLNTCAKADQTDYYQSVGDLRAELAEPGFDPERDLRLWHDSDGQLVAMAQLWVPKTSIDETTKGFLGFQVHPSYRNRSLEFDLIAWGEVRVQAIAQERGTVAKLSLGCRDYQRDRIQLYEQCGYQYERCFLQMLRSLSEPIPEPQFPAAFTLAHQRGVADAAAWVEAYNESFIDHWNFHPINIEEHSYWLAQPTYQPELDLVAIAPNGQIAAFCFCQINHEDNQQRGCKEGGIHILGTRRGFRRLGLARAMLLTAMHKLKAAGMDTARLGVDTENPNQAQSLYQSAGFYRKHASLSYAKLCQEV
ncbi:GNAT family N-acetyltransferase [Phormidium tenue FACHB-886]|nr:GNAT family N-acetyltransferase [Phormidium tenue FACHB-886]